MAKFNIYSKDGSAIRYSGALKYNGTYLKVSSVDFGTIYSDDLIGWQVGDYVDYSRTGLRYRLYCLPNVTRQGKNCGDAISYTNLVFYEKTKELELTLFRDYVVRDNMVHFSTQSKVETFENVEGIIRRIGACMEQEYPGEWEVKLYDGISDDFRAKVSEALDFAVEGSVMDACNKMYELWGIGWVHEVVSSKDVLIFGKPNTREESNTTDKYEYGRGKGFVSIKETVSNADELCTLLYAYGSSNNLPARHYNQFDIKDASGVDIQHLMIPMSKWGKTDGKPDASKAFIKNDQRITDWGMRRKIVYFDGNDQPEIYPSLEQVTYGELRDVMDSEDTFYPHSGQDSQRIDKILEASYSNQDVPAKYNIEDYVQESVSIDKTFSGMLRVGSWHFHELHEFEDVFFMGVPGTTILCTTQLKFEVSVPERDAIESVCAIVAVQADSWDNPKTFTSFGYREDDRTFVLKIDKWDVPYDNLDTYTISIKVGIKDATISPTDPDYGTSFSCRFVSKSDIVTFAVLTNMSYFCKFRIPLIGFNLREMIDNSSDEWKYVSMKRGECEGRELPIMYLNYNAVQNSDQLNIQSIDIVCRRVYDDSTGQYYPNSLYQVKTDDEFVFIGIAMPDIYVTTAENKLYQKALEYYNEHSELRYTYEPVIDAKVVIEEERVLREGMYLKFIGVMNRHMVSDIKYVMIDTLTIDEGTDAIPTYKVTLRDDKAISTIGKMQREIKKLKMLL